MVGSGGMDWVVMGFAPCADATGYVCPCPMYLQHHAAQPPRRRPDAGEFAPLHRAANGGPVDAQQISGMGEGGLHGGSFRVPWWARVRRLGSVRIMVVGFVWSGYRTGLQSGYNQLLLGERVGAD